VSEQQKQHYPISVNIAQYPITQYQYRSNPTHGLAVSSFVAVCSINSQAHCQPEMHGLSPMLQSV